MIQRRAAAAGYTAAQVDLLGGHSLRSGSSPRRSAPAPTPTPSRGRPVPRSEDARGLRPGVRAPGRQRGAEIGPVTTPVTSAGTAKPLSASTQAGYAADWALFADWCAATSVVSDRLRLPGDPTPGDFARGRSGAGQPNILPFAIVSGSCRPSVRRPGRPRKARISVRGGAPSALSKWRRRVARIDGPAVSGAGSTWVSCRPHRQRLHRPYPFQRHRVFGRIH